LGNERGVNPEDSNQNIRGSTDGEENQGPQQNPDPIDWFNRIPDAEKETYAKCIKLSPTKSDGTPSDFSPAKGGGLFQDTAGRIFISEGMQLQGTNGNAILVVHLTEDGKIRSGSIYRDDACALAHLYGENALDANPISYPKRPESAGGNGGTATAGQNGAASSEIDNVAKLLRNGLTFNSDEMVTYKGNVIVDRSGNPIPKAIAATWPDGKIPVGTCFLGEIRKWEMPTTVLQDGNSNLYRCKVPSLPPGRAANRISLIVRNGGKAAKLNALRKNDSENVVEAKVGETIIRTGPGTKLTLKDINGDTIRANHFNDEGRIARSFFAPDTLALIQMHAPGILEPE
jgi:hypothetical protein